MGGALHLAGEDIESTADADENRHAQRRTVLGDPFFLLGYAHRHAKNIRSGHGDFMDDGDFLTLPEVAVSRAEDPTAGISGPHSGGSVLGHSRRSPQEV